MKIIFFFSLILSFFLTPADGVNRSIEVRILIKSTDQTVTIKTSGSVYLTEEKTSERYLLVDDAIYEITAWNNLISINTQKLTSPVIIESANPHSYLTIDGTKYRGKFKLYLEGGKLNIVEYLDIERYLWGVLAPEMGPTWPYEALKAQAVAARTYALYHLKKGVNYDLTATTKHQLYTGFERISPQIISAVNETAGEVLVYNGKIFPAYYHANSGGHTTTPSAVWNTETIHPLKGIPDPYSRFSKNYSWSLFILARDIVEFLNRNGEFVSKVKDIKIHSKDRSGRVVKFAVITDKGKIKVDAKALRDFLGGYEMKSTLITRIEKTRNGFKLYGRGWGHGIGLSQDGAKRMADLGYSYKKILEFYYPKAKIVDIEKVYELR